MSAAGRAGRESRGRRGRSMSTALEVRDLPSTSQSAPDCSAGTASVRAVDGVSFDVRAGQTMAIVASPAAGKSTGGSAVLRLIEPSRGTVKLDGAALLGCRPAGAARGAAAGCSQIFQDPYGSLNPAHGPPATCSPSR